MKKAVVRRPRAATIARPYTRELAACARATRPGVILLPHIHSREIEQPLYDYNNGTLTII
ncbi:hypothetical protein ACJJIK_15035 [Microbulbifer sp. ZKSA006]|uniref:hypothetical protein n=1 Tax=Microbulbifer sp. ZKSA006 TaxID=3243390 RepID=UPI0040397BB6